MAAQLVLSTIAFGIAFAVWGCFGGAAPLLKESFALSPVETSLLVSVPVIVGSLGRIPMGLLTDRLGARLAMSGALTVAGLCALAIATFELPYRGLLVMGAFMGISGTTFAIGVAHVSGWFPPSRQGFALGVFGVGNIGQSVAVFGIPSLAWYGSWKTGFMLFGLLAIAWAILYWTQAREAERKSRGQKMFQTMFDLLRQAPMSWVLSTYYFLTFGGFVAMSVYLPTLFKDQFLLTPQEAGVRTALFVVLATGMRVAGGWLSDRFGAARILGTVFLTMIMSSILLKSTQLSFFILGIVLFAIACGVGNGAVFKLVPQYFPHQTGTAGGLVGAVGGMGGFFPPILMAFSFERYGDYFLGWIGLALFSLLCLLILWRQHAISTIQLAEPT